MPTLVHADNFGYKGMPGAITGLSVTRVFDIVSNSGQITFDPTTYTRDGRGFMKFAENGVLQTNGQKYLDTGVRTLVASFYFVANTAPSTSSVFIHSTTSHRLWMNTSGHIGWDIGNVGAQSIATNFADGQVHRIDLLFDSTGTTYTLDVKIDGQAGTQAQRTGQVAADILRLIIGSLANADDLTFWVQDLVISSTSGDYPIGGHRVLSLYPDGDGTHSSMGANVTEKYPGGADITTGTTDAYQYVDAWRTGAADTSTYIQLTATTSTQFAEVTFDNITAGLTYWDVFGYAAAKATSTTVCRATARYVDSGGTTVGEPLADADVSDASYGFHWKKLTAPGGSWDDTEINGLKCRIGLTTDVAPDPQVGGAMLMVAVAYTDPAPPTNYTLTGTVKNITFGAGTHTATPTHNYTLSGTVKNVTFSAGTHTATYTPGSGTQNYTLTGTVKNITFGAGAHTATPTYNYRLTGTVANITFAAGTHVASPTYNYRLTGTVANITFAAGTHTATPTFNYVLAGTVANITFGAGTHTGTYTPGTGGAAYTLQAIVKNITFTPGVHSARYHDNHPVGTIAIANIGTGGISWRH